MLNTTLNTNSALERALESSAVATARQNRGAATENLYVKGETTRLTKERAFAAELEANPELYAQYRAQHNAGSLVATLEAAGYKLVRQ